MEKYPDFTVRDTEMPSEGYLGHISRFVDDAPHLDVVYAVADIDNVDRLREADNIQYSSRSRLARAGIETGIFPINSSRDSEHLLGFEFVKSFRGDFEPGDLYTDGDKIGAFVSIRNMNRKAGKSGPELTVMKGDSLGRLFSFDDDDVAIVEDKREAYRRMSDTYDELTSPGGPQNNLRFYSESSSHPDLDTILDGHRYERGPARVLMPVDGYYNPAIEDGNITVEQLEKRHLSDMLEERGDLPETVDDSEAGVHYAYTEWEPVGGMNLWIQDPMTFSTHLSSTLIDSDFSGDRIALEFLFDVPEGDRWRFPERVPAFAIS